MKRIQPYLPVLAIFSLALLVRVVYNFTVAHGYIPKYDAALYDIIAQNIVKQHCFCRFTHHPTVSRAPLWPFIMAAIYFFTGPQNVYPRLFYCLLGSGTCVLVYLFARDLFGRRIALCTGLLASVYTGLFIYDGWLFSESLYTFLLTLLAYSLFRLQRALPPPNLLMDNSSLTPVLAHLQRTQQCRWIICSGLSLGLAALTRPNGPLLFGLLFLWACTVVLAKIVPWRTTIKTTLLIASIAVVLIAPWTYRNYTVTHQFVPVALGMGDVLVGAYNDTVLRDDPITGPGYWVNRDLVRPPVDLHGHDAYEYTPANEKTDIAHALRWISMHVRDMPYLLTFHFIHMWTPLTFEPGLPFKEFADQPASRFIESMIYAMTIPVFLLAACGLVLTWRRWKKALVVVYLALALTTMQNLAFYANMRFRAPIEPLLVLLVGGALYWLTAEKFAKLHDALTFHI